MTICPPTTRPSLPRAIAAFLVALGLFSVVASAATSPRPPGGGSASTPASLGRPPSASFLETVLEGKGASQKSCKPQGLIEDCQCDFETVEDVNTDLAARLGDIIQLPFFRYQKIDLFRECPFWQEDGSCMNRACAVQETDEDHIPEAWRSGTLGKVKEALGFPQGLKVVSRNDDFCVLDEDNPESEGVYVDLYENPERFTGYAGPSANKVWKAIYEENCFDVVPFLPPSRAAESGGSGYVGSSLIQDKSQGVRNLMGTLGLAAPSDPQDEMCLEKRVYYRVISGLHASISIHICAEYLDQSTGEWRPNLECFITRIAEHPERLQNVYFNYVLMLRALTKAAPYLQSYDYATGDAAADAKTKEMMQGLLDSAASCQATFDETSMFSGPEAAPLLDEFKSHFRNVSRIMDCVGCDKCRLWGKTQITGLATGLKLLFSFDDAAAGMDPSHVPMSPDKRKEDFHLKRSEIIAFIWVVHRFSESLAAVEQFRQMWAQRSLASEGAADPAEAARHPTQEELQADAVEPTAEQVKQHKEDIDLAVPEIFQSPSASGTPPQPEYKAVNSSSYSMTPGPNGLGPRISTFLEKIMDACRTSLAACLMLVERGLAFVTGSIGSSSRSHIESKSEL